MRIWELIEWAENALSNLGKINPTPLSDVDQRRIKAAFQQLGAICAKLKKEGGISGPTKEEMLEWWNNEYYTKCVDVLGKDAAIRGAIRCLIENSKSKKEK